MWEHGDSQSSDVKILSKICFWDPPQMVKTLPVMWETWVWSVGWEDPREKGMATHSSIIAWRIPWTEEPGGLQSMGSQRFGYDWATNRQHTLGDTVAKTPPLVQGVRVQSLVRALDPKCHNWKITCAETKTQCRQINLKTKYHVFGGHDTFSRYVVMNEDHHWWLYERLF